MLRPSIHHLYTECTSSVHCTLYSLLPFWLDNKHAYSAPSLRTATSTVKCRTYHTPVHGFCITTTQKLNNETGHGPYFLNHRTSHLNTHTAVGATTKRPTRQRVVTDRSYNRLTDHYATVVNITWITSLERVHWPITGNTTLWTGSMDDHHITLNDSWTGCWWMTITFQLTTVGLDVVHRSSLRGR